MPDAKPHVLLQLDSDPHPSVFDAIVAVDAGVDHVLRHGGVRPEEVRNLVYGAIFTRGVEDLRQTAVFVGGSDVTLGERLLAEVRQAFLGPLRVSVMIDSAGANTTAAAAVLAAAAHLGLSDAEVLVLGASGTVGRRLAELLARQGARVRASSITMELAEAACQTVRQRVPHALITPWVTSTVEQVASAAQGVQAVLAAGPPGTQIMPAVVRRTLASLRVAIDLNAVAPVGLEGINPLDRATPRDGAACYGAIGVGGLKMKIHKACLRRLFDSNDQVLDLEAIYQIARGLPEAAYSAGRVGSPPSAP